MVGLNKAAHSLLVHQPFIGAIVHDTLTKDGGRKFSIDLFSIQVGMLAIQDQIISFRTKKHGGGLSK